LVEVAVAERRVALPAGGSKRGLLILRLLVLLLILFFLLPLIFLLLSDDCNTVVGGIVELKSAMVSGCEAKEIVAGAGACTKGGVPRA
jgi:hypothetical protein